jgi:hypothetical protein
MFGLIFHLNAFVKVFMNKKSQTAAATEIQTCVGGRRRKTEGPGNIYLVLSSLEHIQI